MQFTFEEFDFCGENAARTASVMRAIADAVSPNTTAVDTRPRIELAEALADMAKQGTVATHVSAAAVGDVPFGDATAAVDKLPALDLPELAEIAGDLPCGADTPALGGVDAEGYPWDERIHASSRATVADGTWRKKRGVDEALVAEVRAEWDAKLRASVPAPPTEAERLQADHVATMPAEVAPPPPPAAIDPASVGFGTPDGWPDDILGPRTDAAAPFPQFMAYVGKRIGAGELDNARLLAVLNEHGVPLLPALSAPEHVGKIAAIARQLAAV